MTQAMWLFNATRNENDERAGHGEVEYIDTIRNKYTIEGSAKKIEWMETESYFYVPYW